MTRNIGGKDKLIRIFVGSAIFLFSIATNSWFGFIGLIILTTGLLNWCPAYSIFGKNTWCDLDDLDNEKKED